MGHFDNYAEVNGNGKLPPAFYISSMQCNDESVTIDAPIIEYNGKSYNYDDITRDSCTSPVNLVLCLDGTENEFGVLPFTNVLKMFRMLDKDNPNQLCYYQPGIGVKFQAESNDIHESNFLSSKLSKITNKLDAIFAFTLERHVIAAYNFLMRFYKRGDKIYLFGFSRGSFTGRVLAGMIERVGLLNNGLEEMIATAWKLYSNWEYAGQPAQQDSAISLVDEFKETFSRKDVEIHFMGLWESVNSVGIIRDRLFPYTIRSAIVEHVRHAVSIDERRGKYKQVHFQPYSYYPHFFNLDCEDCESSDDMELSSTNSSSPLIPKRNNRSSLSSIRNFFSGKTKRHKSRRLASLPSEDVVELFFSGNHSDCGGGWPPDFDGQYLSDIPFRWILSQAIKFGVKFKIGTLHEFNDKHPVTSSLVSCHHDLLSLRRTSPVQHTRKRINDHLKKFLRIGPDNKRLNYQQIVEQIEIGPRLDKNKQIPGIHTTTSNTTNYQHDLPKSPIKRFDSRGNEWYWKSIAWWIIELLPIGYKIENNDGEWKRIYIPNLGRPRKLHKNALLHWSVFYRLHFVDDYCPKNLPNDLGLKFIESISEFKEIFKDDNIEEFSRDLTIEKIKTDWSSKVWSKIPDELQYYLDKDSNL